MTDVVRRISLLAQKNAPLRLSFSEGTLTVSARTPDVGEASETIPVPFTESPSRSASIPSSCVTGSKAVESDELGAEAGVPAAPGTDRVRGRPGFVYLIMPIRLNV